MCEYFENSKELPSYKLLSLGKKKKKKKSLNREIHQLYAIRTDFSFLYINVTLGLNIIISVMKQCCKA